MKIKSLLQLYEILPEDERLMTDVLRQIVRDTLPAGFKEKLSFSVPYFYGKKGICIIWPATVPRGGFKKGVLLGFWYGCKLRDKNNYLTHGTNKKVYYKIYQSVEEIEPGPIISLLKEAIELDNNW